MALQYFKVQIENVHVKDKDDNIKEVGNKYPDGYDAKKINVRAYHERIDGKPGCDYCIIETDESNTEMINKMKTTGKVIELSAVDAETEITSIRPPKPDIRIQNYKLNETKIDKIKAFLDKESITYQIN